jgi:multidrug efflux pump subunit AcrA (membrane-fusion protein)
MSARVAFLEREVTRDEEAPKTAVNPAALVSRNGKQTVFVVNDDRTVETIVTVGGKIGDGIEVRDGLKPGEKVVVNPPKKLRNGSAIKLKEK